MYPMHVVTNKNSPELVPQLGQFVGLHSGIDSSLVSLLDFEK